MPSVNTVLNRIGIAARSGVLCVEDEIAKIRLEIQADDLARGKICEYRITLVLPSGEKREETVVGVPFGEYLAVRKKSSEPGYQIDHKPTGLHLASFPTKRLAVLVAAEITHYVGTGISSDNTTQAVDSLPEHMRAWLMEIGKTVKFEPYTDFAGRIESDATPETTK